MAPRQCEVCNEARSKYKCPSCLVPYCSLACFKKHKENPCKKPSSPEKDLTTVVLPTRSFKVDDPSWVLNEEQQLAVVSSSEIREALEDRELRILIHKIDSSKDPEDEIARAMEGQSFRDFADKVLSTVDPQE